jgi:hypothetical protein
MTQANVLPSDRRHALLREMIEKQIEQEGSMSSFMVRAGLLLDILDEGAKRDASVRELVEALKCAERDLTATYEVAKAGKVAIISIGQFQRLDRIRAALASAGAQP